MHRFFYHLILLLMTFYTGASVQSQEVTRYNYTDKDGLPSKSVYFILQAKNGYLWFGTNQGVSKYDGQNFTNFNVSDGLLNDDVFILTEDSKGRIWIGSYTAGLCFIEDDSVHYFEHNDKLEEIIQNKTVKQSLYFDTSGYIYFGDGLHNMLLISPEGKIEILGQEKRNVFEVDGAILTSTHKNKSKDVNFVAGKNIYGFYQQSSLQFRYEYYTTPNQEKIKLGSHYAIKYDDDLTLICQGNHYLVKEKHDFFHASLSYSTDCIFKDNKNRVWIGSRGQGLYVYSDPYLEQLEMHLLDGLTVTHVAEDFQGGIWCSTLEQGVFHFPFVTSVKNNFQSLPSAEIIDLIQGPSNILFVLFKNGDVWECKGKICQKICSSNNITPAEPILIYYDSLTSTLFLKSQNQYSKDNKNYLIRNIPLISQSKPKSATYQFLINPHGKLFDIRGRGIYRDHSGERVLFYGEELEYNRIQSVLYYDETVWLGTMKGLYFIADDTLKKFDSKLLNDKKIVSMDSYKDRLAYAIEDLGIVVQKDKQQFLFTSDHGFSTLKFTSISYDKKGSLFVGTRDGLYHLSEDTTGWNLKKVSGQQGVSSTKINKVLVIGDMTYIGTELGLKAIDRNSINSKIIAPVIYSRIEKINGQSYRGDIPILLPYDKNSIEVQFTSIDFAEKRKSTFKWKLNEDKTWQLTDNAQVYFDRLAPGNYSIRVQSSVIPGIWSNESLLFFEISPPFWLTWWFITSMSLLFLGLIFLIFRLRSQKIKSESKKAMQLLQEKADLEMKALRAQMNPHFIFNTLTSIQYLIASNQNERAEYYLEKFSRLLRLVVDKTEESFVTLLEELDMIRIYVDLENLRYDDKVEFNLNMPLSMEIENIKIPGMILQPFVENAIEHGLSKKEGKGRLDLNISAEKNILHIVIKDDGIGRQKAKKIIKNGGDHKSVGMTNVLRRIKLMNIEIDDLDGKVEVIDLEDKQGKPIGTQVNIDVKFTLK